MSAEDLELYEEYLAEQEFQAQHEDELEALADLENEAIQQSSKSVQMSENVPRVHTPPVVEDIGSDMLQSDNPLIIDEELVIDEDDDTNKRKRITLNDSPDFHRALKRSRFEVKRTRVLRIPPLECSSVRLCSLDGDVRYLRKVDLGEFEYAPTEDSGVSLLGRSMAELKAEANALRDEMDNRRQVIHPVHQLNEHPRIEWTSTYRAKQYTELLSDEYINRAILKWLKMWSPCVFKTKIQKKEKQEQPQFSKNGKFTKDGKFDRNVKFKYKNKSEHIAAEEDEMDPLGRPKYKTLMLCGPPGLGKTTLAYVAANHSGYNTVEINSSDDRAGESFRNRVDQALTNRSANDKRPSCLILDEIDGIHHAAAKFLLTRIQAGKTTGKKTKKTKKEIGPLIRPIICICNDPYVPALRELRHEALILHFNGIDRSRLTARLEEVCRMNKVKTDRSALVKLAEKTEDDIRSCINSLQFLSMANNPKTVSLEDVSKVTMGKDQQRTLQYAMKHILSVGQKESVADRFANIIDITRSFGETEKLVTNVFELCGEIRAPSSMESVAQSRHWLTWSDQITRFIGQTQNYRLEGAKSFTIAAQHLYLAQNGAIINHLKSKNVAWDIRTRTQQSENLLQSLRNGLATSMRNSFEGYTLVMEMPSILNLMEPNIRQVNPSLLSKSEKMSLEQCVNTMCDFGMSLKQTKNEETKYYEFILEPPLESLATFPSEDTVLNKGLSTQTKMLLSAEVERERIRRSMKIRHADVPLNDVTNSQSQKKDMCPAMQAVIRPRKIQDSTLPKTPERRRGLSMFITKTKRMKSETKLDEPGAPTPKVIIDPGVGNSDVYFKFNAGYSNAVRQTVLIKDL